MLNFQQLVVVVAAAATETVVDLPAVGLFVAQIVVAVAVIAVVVVVVVAVAAAVVAVAVVAAATIVADAAVVAVEQLDRGLMKLLHQYYFARHQIADFVKQLV